VRTQSKPKGSLPGGLTILTSCVWCDEELIFIEGKGWVHKSDYEIIRRIQTEQTTTARYQSPKKTEREAT